MDIPILIFAYVLFWVRSLGFESLIASLFALRSRRLRCLESISTKGCPRGVCGRKTSLGGKT